MKLTPKILALLCVIIVSLSAAIPSGYYDTASGLSGANLRQELHDIIDGHTVKSYDYAWTAFASTDIRTSLGSDYIWCMYTEQEFHHDEDQQGKYTMDQYTTYNREHSWPKSWANEYATHYSDLFHLYPVQSNSNTNRSNLPYGEVGSNITYTSSNGTLKGDARPGLGYSGTVFEPIDEYKGDLARTYFYISTRYYGEDGTWNNVEMADGCDLKEWAVDMLIAWHELDPVSTKETDRNDAIYAIQGNRNPFIDHPEYVDSIWASSSGSGSGSGSSVDSTEIFFSEYIEGSSNNKAIEIYNNTGQSVDLGFIVIKTYYNGNTSPGNTVTLGGTLGNGEVYVISNSLENASIQSESDLYSAVCNFNGNDAIEMLYNGSLIDIIGTVGSATIYAEDVTLVRKTGIGQGATTYVSTDWDTYSMDETSFLGSHSISEEALPITLQNFNAEYMGAYVRITWSTASEVENSRFLLYRNDDLIAEIDGAGTSSEMITYIYDDNKIKAGETYTYYISDVDLSGHTRSHLNKATTLTIPESTLGLPATIGKVYPNPFNPRSNLPLTLNAQMMVNVDLYDLQGNRVSDVLDKMFSAGEHTIMLDLSHFPSAMYLLQVNVGDVQQVQKLVLSK